MVNVKKSTSWVVLGYAIVLFLLGYWAYLKAGSKISLYTSGAFGILLAISAMLMFCNIRFGRHAALFLTVLLTATFAIRYSVSQKGMPAILSVLSAAMLLFLIARTVDWKR